MSTWSAQIAVIASLALVLTVPARGDSPKKPVAPPTTGNGHVVVTMSAFHSDRGLARVALFRSKRGFPSDPKRAARTRSVRIRRHSATVVFENIPAGSFAIAAFHDENSNDKLDTNAIGIPTEGYGASRDANNRFGPPEYEDARLKLRAGAIEPVALRMRY